MIRAASLLGLAGLALATALFLWQGLGAVLAAFAAAGFGILWASLFHLVSMAFNARAWQVLLPTRATRSTLGFYFRAVWLREAVNGLLPVARIGGEVASAHYLIRRGLSARLAVASLVVDVTVSLVSQYVFALIGLALLMRYGGALWERIALGLLAVPPVFVLLALAQKKGFFGLFARMVRALFGGRFGALAGTAGPIDLSVRRLYWRRGPVIACGLWQLVGWIAGAGEIVLALYFLGAPRDFAACLALEALIQAIASGAFIVPAAVGVQEGGFLVLGTLIGLTPEVALALMRRARDILIFLPALMLWQMSLGRHVLRGPAAPAG